MPRPIVTLSSNVNDTVRSLIASAGSRYGSVAFIKKDGTLRHLTFQQARDNSDRIRGTERGQRASMTFNQNNPNMLRLWDTVLARRGVPLPWRTVTLDRVLSIRVNGTTYRVRNRAGE